MKPRLAIVSAMAEELHGLEPAVTDGRHIVIGQRQFTVGVLHGVDVVLVLSRIGKVAAATTTSVLLTQFGVNQVLFTGVAGGLGHQVQVGDVVLAEHLLQHDMDASPLFPRYEVPLYGKSLFATDANFNAQVLRATQAALAQVHDAGKPQAQLHRGLVLSGDLFVSTSAQSADLRVQFPQALAVEMEGAAVAQVCCDFGVPCAVLRTISDRADDAAHGDFQQFIQQTAARYTRLIVRQLLTYIAAL